MNSPISLQRPDAAGSAPSSQDVTRRSDTLPAPRKIPRGRKPRSDSTLDSRLSAAQADELAKRLEHGLSLRAAAEHLLTAFGIRLSRVSISRWAARRRRAKTELTLASLMRTVAEDRERAASLDPSAPADLHQANEMFASHALFTAHVHGNPHDVRQASRLFVDVLGALTRKGRVDARGAAAEIQLRKLAAE